MKVVNIKDTFNKSNCIYVDIPSEHIDATNPFSVQGTELYTESHLKAFIYWLRNDVVKLSELIYKDAIVQLKGLESRRVLLIKYLSRVSNDIDIVYDKDVALANLYYRFINKDIWFNPNEIKRIEYVHSVHMRRNQSVPDLHLVKERFITNNDCVIPNVKLVKDYKVPYFITKKIFQDHEQKKETEDLSKVERFESNVTDLVNNVGTKLRGRYYSRDQIRDIRPSPYIYGLDVSSHVHMKLENESKYGPATSPATYAALDTENDIETGELTLSCVVMCRDVELFVTKEFVSNVKGDVKEQILSDFYERTVQKLDKDDVKYDINDVNINIEIVDNAAIAVKRTFEVLHKWKPDIVGIWNILHDMPLMIDMLKKWGYAEEDVMCDPSIPQQSRLVKLNRGSLTSPKGTPLPPRSQWHTYDIPASFVILDAMSTYNFVRVGGNQEPGGYGIDNILKVNLGLSKLKVKEAEGLVGVTWHNYVSKKLPTVYAAYNIWDTLSMILLEEHIKDMSVSLAPLSIYTEYKYFNSGPRKIVDKLYVDGSKAGFVVGTKDNYNDKRDTILTMSNWIVTLDAFRTIDKGISPIEGLEGSQSNVKPATSDIDATASYPSNTAAANISMNTTKTEIISVENMTREEFKTENMNILYGPVNANRYAVNMFNVPTILDVDKEFSKEFKK